MLRKVKVTFRRWVSGKSLSADLFRIAVCFSVFATGLFTVKYKGRDALNWVVEAPSRVSNSLESQREDEHNRRVIKEAQRLNRDAQLKACEIVSKTRGQLIRCISELD